jgi:hypothetical protein
VVPQTNGVTSQIQPASLDTGQTVAAGSSNDADTSTVAPGLARGGRVPTPEPVTPTQRQSDPQNDVYLERATGDPANGTAVIVVDENGVPEPLLMSAASDAMRSDGRHPVTPFRSAAIAAGIPRKLADGSTDLLHDLHMRDVCREVLVGTISRATSNEADANMQGLITTRLHLRFQLIESRSGTMLQVFERDVRGAGFTASTSETQANERAAGAIREMLTTK